jgi:hypothetical protein
MRRENRQISDVGCIFFDVRLDTVYSARDSLILVSCCGLYLCA